MKFEKIKAGDVLYDVHSYRMGNMTIRSVGVWDVRVLTIDATTRSAIVSWNGNRPETMHERSLVKLRGKRPILIEGFCGSRRLARRGEVAK